MPDLTIGIKDDEDRRRVGEALQGMYERSQQPPELPPEQRTVGEALHREEYRIDLVIFALEGTLVQSRSGLLTPQHINDRTPMVRTEQVIAKLHDEGAKVALVTNQEAIAFGQYDPTEMRNTTCQQVYTWFGINNWDVVICPHHPRGTDKDFARECACRLPSPYMLLLLIDRHHIGPKHALFVGNTDDQREAAVRAGCHFMWAREYFLRREWR